MTTKPTEEELAAWKAKLKESEDENITYVQQRTDWTEKQKEDEIQYIQSGQCDVELCYTKVLCEKCDKFAVEILYDFLGKYGFVCKACKDESWDVHFSCDVKQRIAATNRKHNLEETDWGRIIESELKALEKTESTLTGEIVRLRKILESDREAGK